MTPRDRLVAALVADLEHDHAAYYRLKSCTAELHEHLASRDGEAISRLNAEITRLTDDAAARAARRSRILVALGFASDGEGMRALLATLADEGRAGAAEASWRAIGQLAQTCREQNERNGRLLALQHDVLRQLLARPEAGAVYAPSGV